jgi:hemolysin activation/secretion protein
MPAPAFGFAVAAGSVLSALAAPNCAWAQSAARVPEPPALLAPEGKPAAAPVSEVRQYVVLGVTLLPAGSVEAALGGWIGPRTVEDLHRAAGIVQALYARAGYGAVVAYLPPQEVSGGVITLQVIEGRLAATRVEGSGRGFDEAGILASLPALQPGRTPRLDKLDVQLRMANDNPAKRTRLVLLPGRQPEQTEAEVAVQTGARRQWSLELDNTGTSSSGRARVGVGWRDANASGRDDVIDLRLQVSPEYPQRFAAASVNWRLPLYAQATMLDAYALASDTQSEDIPTAAGDLRFAGRGLLLGLKATRYLRRWQAFDPRLSLAIERRDQRNQCAIGTLPEDACGSAGGDLAITPLLLEGSLTGDAQIPLALSVSLVQGLAVGGQRASREAFDAVRPGARPSFTTLRTQASWQQRLGNAGWDAVARLGAQWSADPLVPAMQFGAGGRDSVRGYEERELAADHGLALSLQLSAPRSVPAAGRSATWRPLLFADAAVLRNRDEVPCSVTRTRCNLAAAGVGVRLEAASLGAGLDIAHTLRDGGTTERGRTRAHLWLRFTP